MIHQGVALFERQRVGAVRDPFIIRDGSSGPLRPVVIEYERDRPGGAGPGFARRGRVVARPLRSRGSADVVAHAGANALAILEAERKRARAGERAPALLLSNFLERGDAA